MNRLYKNICYDIRVGFGRNLANYVVWTVTVVFLTCLILSEMRELFPDRTPSYFDVMSRFFLGVEENDIRNGAERIEIPFEWLTLQTYIVLGIARYPRQDYDECGYNVWIRTRSRSVWWVSKVIWCLFHIVLSYVVCALVVAAVVGLSGGDCSMNITNPYHLSYRMSRDLKIYAALFIMPVIVEFAICAVTMSVCFIANSIVGFLAGFAMLVSGIFFYSKFCPARYMMMYSYFPRMADYRFSVRFGLLFCLAVAVCGLAAGYMAYVGKEWQGEDKKCM